MKYYLMNVVSIPTQCYEVLDRLGRKVVSMWHQHDLKYKKIRWIHHFKDKVSTHLSGRLEQAVTIRMSILLMLQLISPSTLYSHNTVDISLGCLPDFLTTEPCGYHILQQHGQMGISPLQNTYSKRFLCVIRLDVYGAFLSSSCKI